LTTYCNATFDRMDKCNSAPAWVDQESLVLRRLTLSTRRRTIAEIANTQLGLRPLTGSQAMFNCQRYCAVALLVACVVPCTAVGQTLYFPNSATINSSVSGLVYVGKDSLNRNSSPVVNIVAGADLWQGAMVFNGSQVNMSGGRIRTSLIALEASTVSITGGEIGGSLWTGERAPRPSGAGLS
jgi:hypothetical protein